MGKIKFAASALPMIFVSLNSVAADLGQWTVKNEALVLKNLPVITGQGVQGRGKNVVETNISVVAERTSPSFPGAPYESQATATSKMGDDIMITFGTSGEPTGGGIEWIRWDQNGPVVIDQEFRPEWDFFSVVQVLDSVIAVGQMDGRGAFLMQFRKNADGSGFKTLAPIKYLNDYTALDVQVESSGPNAAVIRVLTGSNGGAYWFSVARDQAIVELGQNEDITHPMGSVNSCYEGYSYVLEGSLDGQSPATLSFVGRPKQNRRVVGKMDLGFLQAPATVHVEGRSVVTNAGAGQLRHYWIKKKGGLNLLHYQQLDGVGNDMEIRGPFAALSQGDAGFMIAFVTDFMRPFDIQQVIANPPLSANKGTMMRVGQKNFVFTSGGRKGMKILEQKTALLAQDGGTYSFHGPARFWINKNIPEFAGFNRVTLRFTKPNGHNMICKWKKGNFDVCNWPVPDYIDIRAIDVEWSDEATAPKVAKIPLGFAI